MKKLMLLAVVLGLTTFDLAQIGVPPGDVLGAHLNYGRGCAACHAPHSGAYGNGAAKAPQTVATTFLWGQDTSSLLGKTIVFSGNVVEVLPSSVTAGTPDVTGVLLCLSCHDGNYAEGAMMQNKIYETVNPQTYGGGTIPTLMGNEGALGPGNYLANHPAGLNAVVTCGTQYTWDCTETNGVINMNGPNSSQFVKNYGFFVALAPYNNTAVVTCISCHNQHLMNIVSVTNGPNSGLPTGFYLTMFFIRAPYNGENSTNLASNQNAQFCRQCHGSVANESNGGSSIPTIF
jgi:cytochrome c553